jgi:YidC/Oxa1 family membrane protein insertase
MSDNKNLIAAVGISIAIMAGFYYFYEKPRQEQILRDIEQKRAKEARGELLKETSDIKEKEDIKHDSLAPLLSLQEALKKDERVLVETKRIKGSINLTTGSFDDIVLKDYRQKPDATSENVVLLRPNASKDAYNVTITPVQGDAVNKWQVDRQKINPEKGTHDIFLTATTTAGLDVKRHIRIDENFLLTTTDTVKNITEKAVTIASYAEVRRVGTPETGGYYILHEGLLGYIGKSLKEFDYDKIQEKKEVSENTTGGWLGMTDKYWLVALIPDQKREAKTYFKADTSNIKPIYITGYSYGSQVLEPGQSTKSLYHTYAGAKELKLLDEYETLLGFEHFDLAIDFGWFYFITKPFFFILTWLNSLLGNFGFAIIGLTLLAKVILFPLANKSYRSMSRMKSFQPKIEALKARFGEDKMRLNQEMMALYKKEKINPASGCLPMLIQAPVFFALYKVLFVSIEMRHAPFYGWIHDLSAPDPTSVFNLFGMIPWDPPSMLQIGAWPLVMGLTMWLQQKMNPQPTDPAQATMMLIMPVMFTYLFASFPAGLVIYWTVNNILSMAQQYAIMRIEANRPALPAANLKKKR